MALYQSRHVEPMIFLALGTFFAGLVAFVLINDQVDLTFDAKRLAVYGLGIGIIVATILCLIIAKYSLRTISGGTKFAIIIMMWQGIALAVCAFAFYSNFFVTIKSSEVEPMAILSKQEGKGATHHWYGITVMADGKSEQIYVCRNMWENIDTNQHKLDVAVSTGFWGFRHTSAAKCN